MTDWEEVFLEKLYYTQNNELSQYDILCRKTYLRLLFGNLEKSNVLLEYVIFKKSTEWNHLCKFKGFLKSCAFFGQVDFRDTFKFEFSNLLKSLFIDSKATLFSKELNSFFNIQSFFEISKKNANPNFEKEVIALFPWDQTFFDTFNEVLNWDTIGANQYLPWSVDIILGNYKRWNWQVLLKNKSINWNEIIGANTQEFISFSRGLENQFKSSLSTEKNGFKSKEEILFGLFNLPNIPWDSSIMETFSKYFDFYLLSKNESVKWSFSFVLNNLDKFDLKKLKMNKTIPWTRDFVRLNSHLIDWSILSQNEYFDWSIQFVEENFDKFNLNHLIANKSVHLNYDLGLLIFQRLEQIVEYIPPISYFSRIDFINTDDLVLFLKEYGSYSGITNLDYELSNLTNVNWNVQFIKNNILYFNWRVLSQNPSLPWSKSLLEEFIRVRSVYSSGIYYINDDEFTRDQFYYSWDSESLSNNKGINWTLDLIKESSTILKYCDWGRFNFIGKDFTPIDIIILLMEKDEENCESVLFDFFLNETCVFGINEVNLILKYSKSIKIFQGIETGFVDWSFELIDLLTSILDWNYISKYSNLINWKSEVLYKYYDELNFQLLFQNDYFNWNINQLLELYDLSDLNNIEPKKSQLNSFGKSYFTLCEKEVFEISKHISTYLK